MDNALILFFPLMTFRSQVYKHKDCVGHLWLSQYCHGNDRCNFGSDVACSYLDSQWIYDRILYYDNYVNDPHRNNTIYRTVRCSNMYQIHIIWEKLLNGSVFALPVTIHCRPSHLWYIQWPIWSPVLLRIMHGICNISLRNTRNYIVKQLYRFSGKEHDSINIVSNYCIRSKLWKFRVETFRQVSQVLRW